MPAYVIADIDVRSPDQYEEYKRLAPASIAAYGGRYLLRGGETEILEGGWSPRRCVVLEFPSMDRARAWWNSTEYRSARELRRSSSVCQMILVEGVPAAGARSGTRSGAR